MYGDWQLIYTSPVVSWVPYIATVHAIIVAALLYAFLGKAPALWFAGRTRPNWENKRQLMLEGLKANPSADAHLDLGWHYYQAGLSKLAEEESEVALKMNPQFADPLYLQAWIQVERNKIPKAQELLTELSQNPNASTILQSRALMAVGQLEETVISTKTKKGPVPPEMWKLPLEAFTAASQITPEFGDPKFYRARALNKAGLHMLALDELEQLSDCRWLDPKLSNLVQKEVDLAIKLSSPEQ